jgi:predicted HTH domain antitoxin
MSTSADLTAMSLMALKKMAKGRRIKQYYVLPKAKLVELLGLPELPRKYKIEKMTIMELREIAKERGLRGFWSLNKEDLTRALFPKDDDTIENAPTHEKQQDDGQTGKHEEPQKENADEVWKKVVENA